MTECAVIILDFKRDGLFDAVNPELLSHQGVFWEQDVNKLSPWHKTAGHRLADNGTGYIWQPKACEGKPTVIVCGKCTSSMDVARRFIAENRFSVWDSILAVEQTAGRGQHQRTWISPPGNIHAAWRLPHPDSSDELDSRWQGFLSLIAGYLMARIIREEYGLAVSIKWPNDLLVNEKKIGGILTEARSGQLVVGIGINVVFSPEDVLLRNDFAVSATNLLNEGADATPLSLWLKINEKGRLYFNQLTGSIAPDEFIKTLTPYLAWVGRKVLVKTHQQEPFEAVIEGISQQGGLILRVGDRDTVIYAGSIIPA